MDTSGQHIDGKAKVAKAADPITKEELSEILKFGAQNMYKTDDNTQNQKLDEMDLDDILKKAESHETEAIAGATGASSGGEGFLAQFAAIQDVKNDDISWDDIIPLEERNKAEQEDIERRLEEERKALEPRKRAAAPAPGAYQGMDGGERASPDGDDRSEKQIKPSLKKPKVMPPKRTAGERANFLKGA